jgi:sodium-coupled monocarboxylate transporter 8/12
MASFIYAISILIFVPIVLYVPALAFSQVSGINLHAISLSTSLVCVMYTSIGGLRTVVWTDTLQFILMLAAIACVITLGLQTTGGFANVWNAAENGGRLIFFK